MTEIIARPVKYVRFHPTVLYLLPKCFGSFLNNDSKRDCHCCPVSRECEINHADVKAPDKT